MDDAFYQKHLEVVRDKTPLAFQRVKEMNLPVFIGLAPQVTNLGLRVGRTYRDTLLKLCADKPEELSALVAYAVRAYWYACWKACLYLELGRAAGIIGDNEYTQRLSIAEEYAAQEGAAWTMYNGQLGEVENPFLDETGLKTQPTDQIALSAMAIYWLAEADTAVAEGAIARAFDLIHEAYDALNLASGEDMWNNGFESGKEEAATDVATTSAARISLARAGAFARRDRDPKSAAKAHVKECWEEWQKDQDRYDGKAAFARDMLEKQPALTNQKVIEDWCRLWERQSAS